MLLLLALAAGSGGGELPEPITARGRRRRWVWPLPALPDGRLPKVSDPYGPSAGRADGFHSGVDIMYARLPRTLPRGTRLPLPDHGSRGHQVPEGTPVLAVSDGVIWSTGQTRRGYSVTIGHGPDTKLASWYQHLDTLAVPAHTRGKLRSGGAPIKVKAGEVIGTVGWSKLDAAQIRHLHFELRNGTRAFDPKDAMKEWLVI